MTAASATSPLFPVNLVLDRQRVLVVGGGPVATRKLGALRDAGASVTVVAPTATDEIVALDRAGEVRWHERPYRRGEVASYRLAVTATGVPDVDDRVFLDADASGVWVNSADDPARCTFTLPAVARRGDVTVATSTNGRSPALASWMRQRIDARLGPDIDDLLDVLVDARTELRTAGRPTEVDGWSAAFDDGLHELVAGRDLAAARRLLARHLELAPEASIPGQEPST
ncbi:MAG: bifunctional precorrin-2 dehydrogenase/sirohydrochlorin ferrochelatase [Actinomycetota bacterium]